MAKFISYIVFVLLGAAGAAVALTGAFDFLIFRYADVPYSYSQFLLERIPGKRIVIDAGSSALYGIAPEMIERAFGQPVIDVADKAGVPLEMKILRLMKFARRGDTIILPFEWIYYIRGHVPMDFSDFVQDDYATYYASLDYFERVLFVVRALSFYNVGRAVSHFVTTEPFDRARRRYRQYLIEMYQWPNGDRKEDFLRSTPAANENCASYIAVAGDVSPLVEWAATKLANLQAERDARVVITWPSVAGRDCYAIPGGIAPLVERVRSIFGRHGIAVIGEPSESYFAPEHMLNTFYHVDSAAAALRTQRLIAHLGEIGMKPEMRSGLSTMTLVDKAMRDLETTLNGREPTEPLKSGIYKPGTAEFDRMFVLVNGWNDPEEWGMWSRGTRSTIRLLAPRSDCRITFDAGYFGPQQDDYSSVSINESEVVPDRGTPFAIPPTGQPVTIHFFHHNVNSPKNLGLSPDTRYVKYGLQRVVVQCD